MVDRILLNKQEERFFFEYLRVAGDRSPAECAQGIALALETRTQDEILRFYGQTVDTIFKGQRGALEGFTYQKTHRILTKFYDTKVLPLYGQAGGSLEAGGSDRRGVSQKRKDVGSIQDGNGVQDGNDRHASKKKDVDEEALSSGGMAGADRYDRHRAHEHVSGGAGELHEPPKEASQNHSTPRQEATQGVPSAPHTLGRSRHTPHTAHACSQGVDRGQDGTRVVEILFVPHVEDLAVRLTAGGFDPCPRMRLDASEKVVRVMEILERGWETALDGRRGGLRLRAPDDSPAVFRGCAWGDPDRDGELTLMDVMDALGAQSPTTMGYAWDAEPVRSDGDSGQQPAEVPSTTVRERLTAKKGKRTAKKTGGNRRRVKSESGGNKGAGRKQGAGHALGCVGDDNDGQEESEYQGPGASAEKENTANKSFSFEHQAVASFGSPAQESVRVEAGAPEGTAEGKLGAPAGYRIPVGIRNLVKQEPISDPKIPKKRQSDGRNPDGVGMQESDNQLVRNALEQIAGVLRKQQDYNLADRSRAMVSFGKQVTEMPNSMHSDSLLELLVREVGTSSGPSQPSTLPSQNPLPARTPPTKKQRKKGKAKKSSKNGVIEDPRDLAGLSPPSTFKIPEEFTRVGSAGINGASVRSLTDIFATCHPLSPKGTAGGDLGDDGQGHANNPSEARATPSNGGLLNLKSTELPPGLSLKTLDMSMFSLLDGMSNSNWVNKLGEAGESGEQEQVEAVGNRPFAKLFGGQ